MWAVMSVMISVAIIVIVAIEVVWVGVIAFRLIVMLSMVMWDIFIMMILRMSW